MSTVTWLWNGCLSLCLGLYTCYCNCFFLGVQAYIPPPFGVKMGRWSAYFLCLVSMQIVTGPSLSSSTSIMAPNSPVPTGLPSTALSTSQKRW